jgi:hypothetical protein
MKRTASAFAALAASSAPALAHVAPWTSPDPPPLPVQFLISVALMALAGAIIAWQGAALACEALARGRERRRARPAGNRCGAASWWRGSHPRRGGLRRRAAATSGRRPPTRCGIIGPLFARLVASEPISPGSISRGMPERRTTMIPASAAQSDTRGRPSASAARAGAAAQDRPKAIRDDGSGHAPHIGAAAADLRLQPVRPGL